MAVPPTRDVEIISTVDIPSRDPPRTGKIDSLVTYRIGPYQSGMVVLPKEDLTKDKLQAAVKADVEEKAKYVGLKFPV